MPNIDVLVFVFALLTQNCSSGASETFQNPPLAPEESGGVMDGVEDSVFQVQDIEILRLGEDRRHRHGSGPPSSSSASASLRPGAGSGSSGASSGGSSNSSSGSGISSSGLGVMGGAGMQGAHASPYRSSGFSSEPQSQF
jgi:hypothetical protein